MSLWPVLICRPAEIRRLSWPGRLVKIPRWYIRAEDGQSVTHPSTNRARRRVTSLIETMLHDNASCNLLDSATGELLLQPHRASLFIRHVTLLGRAGCDRLHARPCHVLMDCFVEIWLRSRGIVRDMEWTSLSRCVK